MYKDDPMKTYMQDIREYPLINREEEIRLAARIKRGDDSANKKLTVSNLRLVVKIMHDFKGKGLPMLDLISEGNIGLMRAVEKFDPSKGAKFSSYAAWWIKQSMRRALNDTSRIIRIPVASHGKIRKIKTIKENLENLIGREPTNEEIANETDLSKKVVSRLRNSTFTMISLQTPISREDPDIHGTTVEDIIPSKGKSPDKIVADNEIINNLKIVLNYGNHNNGNRKREKEKNDLDEREKDILVQRYGLNGNKPRTLEETSKGYKITRERVRQIQGEALEKLKIIIEKESSEGYENGNGKTSRDKPQTQKGILEIFIESYLRRQGNVDLISRDCECSPSKMYSIEREARKNEETSKKLDEASDEYISQKERSINRKRRFQKEDEIVTKSYLKNGGDYLKIKEETSLSVKNIYRIEKRIRRNSDMSIRLNRIKSY